MMSLGADKVSYIISFGIAPYFKSKMMEKLTKPKPLMFTASFNESFKSVVNKNQSDVHLTFFDDATQEVSTRYFGSSFLGHSTATDIFKRWQQSLSVLNIPNNLVQLGMDGPNVNWAVHKEIVALKQSTSSNCPQLLELGSCGLHVVHGAYKTSQCCYCAVILGVSVSVIIQRYLSFLTGIKTTD